MKKLFSLSAFLILSFFLHAGELTYFSGTWEETLKKAKAENKIVMLDCYTDWCSWCKVMDRSTFKSDSITNEIDQHFVACHREMEKDPEGLLLSMKYHVNGYPSFLFFSGDGKLIHVSVGYMPTPAFYAELKKVEDGKGLETFPGYGPKLDPGFPEFFKKSFGTKDTRVTPKRDTVYAFLDKQKDLTNEVSWAVMCKFPLTEKYAKSVFANEKKLRELYGNDQVDNKIYAIVQSKSDSALARNDEKLLEEAIGDLYRLLPGKNWDDTKFYWHVRFYEKNNEWGKIADMEQAVIDTSNIAVIASSVNGMAWSFYEKCDDIKICERTLPWMKKVTDAKPEYASMDTYAALLYKTGHYKEAKDIAQKAIDLGKKEGENTSETESLLTKINAELK